MAKTLSTIKIQYLFAGIMFVVAILTIFALISLRGNIRASQAYEYDLSHDMSSAGVQLSDQKFTLVWVSAKWCSFCATMRDYLAETATSYADKVNIFELDLDEHPNLVSRLNVANPPTFVVFNKKGEIVSTFGAETKSVLDAKLQVYLSFQN